MDRHKLIGLITITIMVFALCGGLIIKPVHAFPGMQIVESQLTLNNADQQNPDIYEYGLNNYAVVWQDNRNGNLDIYMYYQNYLGNGNWDVQWDNRITASSGNNISPKIYNDTIVYQSNRNGNWDIYMYNITSKVETQITNNTANQQFPEVYGNIIVWQDYREMWWTDPWLAIYPGMKIYMYNLTSNTEERLPLPEQACFSPSISGDRVVYIGENYRTSEYSGVTYYWPYVCAYNLSTGMKFNVAAGPMDDIPISTQIREMSSPAFDGPLTAWTEYVSGGWNVVVRNMTGDATWGSGLGDQLAPDVSKNWIVYQDYNQAYWNIKLYDFSRGILYQATNTLGHQINPVMSTKYANFIVYQDDRSGHWHIYLTAFWSGLGGAFPPVEPITPSRVLGLLQEFKSRIGDVSQIPTSDFAGANNKVKENRRNAMINQLGSAIASIEAAVYTQDLTIRRTACQSAIDQLNDLVGKLDGWSLRGSADTAGSGFTPDWITSPLYLDQMVRSCRNDLQTLLNGIS